MEKLEAQNQSFALPEDDRKILIRKAVLLVVLVPLSVILLVIFLVLVGFSLGDSIIWHIIAQGFFVYTPIGTWCGLPVILRARKEEWLTASFVVTEDGIAKEYPSGIIQRGKWDHIVAFGKRDQTIEFSDGMIISLRYYLSIKPLDAAILNSMLMAGHMETWIRLATAFAESLRVNARGFAVIPRRRIHLYSQFMVWFFAAAILFGAQINGNGEGGMLWIIAGIAITVSLLVMFGAE